MAHLILKFNLPALLGTMKKNDEGAWVEWYVNQHHMYISECSVFVEWNYSMPVVDEVQPEQRSFDYFISGSPFIASQPIFHF